MPSQMTFEFAVSLTRPQGLKVISASELALSPQDILNIWRVALVVLGLVLSGVVIACLARQSTIRKLRSSRNRKF